MSAIDGAATASAKQMLQHVVSHMVEAVDRATFVGKAVLASGNDRCLPGGPLSAHARRHAGGARNIVRSSGRNNVNIKRRWHRDADQDRPLPGIYPPSAG
ncbi:hypothetical protein ACVOMV_03075 [Mesorhizobium atlanticum]